MPLMLDDMRAEFARHLSDHSAARFSMDKALAHVVTLAYEAGMKEKHDSADEIDRLRARLWNYEHGTAGMCAEAAIWAAKQWQEEVQNLRETDQTGWAQAHRLALELECLIMDTKDMSVVSKWWESAMAALDEYNQVKPGAAEEAESWAAMRKAGI